MSRKLGACQYVFDASLSSDLETVNEDLKYAWDFDGDGLFWRASTTNKQVRTFDSHGQKKIFLKVIDSGGMADIAEINIEVAP